jgi:hypothetical protein
MKPIDELVPDESKPKFDLRGIPTHVCVCGCKVWNLKVMFEDNANINVLFGYVLFSLR